jgi:uncharacterized repeat protein (TIGR01451 family)
MKCEESSMKSKTTLYLAGLGVVLVLALWLGVVGSEVSPAFGAPETPDIAAEPSSPSAGFSAGLLEPSATITTCGTIAASTTFTSGNTYLANNCSIVVNAGVTLTIEADVTVMFTGTASALIVNGTLLAESANPSQPITFTSQAATKSPGQWYGLHFGSGSRGRLNNVFVGYAGSGAFNGSSGYWNAAQVRVLSADVQMRNSLVTAGKMTGVYIEGAGLSPVLDTVYVSNNASGDPANPAYAIYQATVNMTSTYRSLNLTGNDYDAVTIGSWRGVLGQDVTLTNGGVPYWLGNCGSNSCSQLIPTGKTLTLQPGVEIQYAGSFQSYRIIVQSGGSLLAEGTVAQPITFTSGMTTPVAGNWQGIQVQANATARLSNCDISYAGTGAGPALEVGSSDVEVRNCHIRDNKSYGIYLAGDSIYPVLDSLELSNNAGRAMYQETINMSPAYGNLTFAGNGTNAVVIDVGPALTQHVTLGGTPRFTFYSSTTAPALWVSAGGGLTVTPGTELLFPGDSYKFLLLVQSGGALVAEGTASQPITFTASITQPGSWQGIQVDANASVHLAYVDLGFAGAGSKPALNTSASDVQVRHSTFHDNAWDGIRIHGTNVAPIFEDVSVLNSGGYGVIMGDDFGSSLVKPTWDGGVISGSVKTGIYLTHWAAALQPILRNLTIANNKGDGVLIEWNGAVPAFENLAISGNTGAAVTQNPDSSPVYRNLTLSGNGTDAVVISGGSIGGGRYWGSGQPELPFQVRGNVAIPSGAFLSLEPGMTMRFFTDTLLYASGSGALYALGTPDRPITFTGLVETPGFWRGIEFQSTSQAILQNCDIGYAGSTWNGKSLNLWSTGLTVVQNCRIHHSLHTGIYSSVSSPILSYNQIDSNGVFTVATDYGVEKGYGGTLDARNNWWGDASGPHNDTFNPGGKGDSVNGDTYYGEKVIFTPWLTAPPTQTLGLGQVVVKTGGPRVVSPGQTVDYAVQYTSLMTRTISNTVLMLQLPSNSQYLESPDGGLYWPDRHQVFWRLGDVPPGGNGIVSARVRFDWGVDWGTKDGTVSILAGANYGQTEMDVTPYLSYTPVTTTGETPLSDPQVATELAAYADMRILFTRAISAGFAYDGWGGTRSTLSTGEPVTQVVLLSSDRSATVFLRRRGTEIQATTMARTYYAVQDTTGGITVNLQSTASDSWGSWAPGSVIQSASPAAGCSCLTNCAVDSLAGCIAGYGALDKVFGAWQCWNDPLSAGCASTVAGAVPGVGCLSAAVDCANDCRKDAGSHCCTEDKVGPPQGIWGKLNDLTGANACQRTPCNTTTGNWGGLSSFTYCAGGQKCVAGKGCGNCPGAVVGASQTVCAAGGPTNSDCNDSDFLWARDPNAKYGPEGDLAPGQLVTYTITYENMGQGDAFGVFVTDKLGEYFDFASVTAYPTATSTLMPNNRTVVWPVGQLGPKGTITSTGAVTLAVRLKTGLPGGTVIYNQATVYFPSVPEETPTNPVVNVIQPVVATPQELQTNYVQPVGITLSGIEVSGLPLTFTVTEDPLNGILGGMAPTLVYTPSANFTGLDRFAFTASNGVTESRPAEVRIRVNPTGDTTPPQVQWTEPVSGALAVAVQASPVHTDTVGPAYAPFINVGFSEDISSTTISTQTVQVVDSAGRVLSRTVGYDGEARQLVVKPRQPLSGGTVYTVTVTTGVQDMAGNPLSADFKWSFLTAGAPPLKYVYLPLVMRNQ